MSRGALIVAGTLLSLALSSGCWTYRKQSFPGGAISLSGKIPRAEAISVRVFGTRREQPRLDGKAAGEIFAERLSERLSERNLFGAVSVIGAEDEPSTPLVLEGSIEALGRQGWWRALGLRTKVLISGRLTHRESGRELFAFERTREGRNIGSEDALVEDLMDRVAEDIAVFLEDASLMAEPPPPPRESDATDQTAESGESAVHAASHET